MKYILVSLLVLSGCSKSLSPQEIADIQELYNIAQRNEKVVVEALNKLVDRVDRLEKK